MNKKDELKKLIERKNKDSGFFKNPPNRFHLIMAMVISPIIILSVAIDWVFNLGWVSEGELTKNVFRIILIVVSIFIPLLTWMQYDTKVREEKKENEKIEKLINELKE